MNPGIYKQTDKSQTHRTDVCGCLSDPCREKVKVRDVYRCLDHTFIMYYGLH